MVISIGAGALAVKADRALHLQIRRKDAADFVEKSRRLKLRHVVLQRREALNVTTGVDVADVGTELEAHVIDVLLGLVLLIVMHDGAGGRDRKSTRLNSSHLGSSYAVFCLKKNSFG